MGRVEAGVRQSGGGVEYLPSPSAELADRTHSTSSCRPPLLYLHLLRMPHKPPDRRHVSIKPSPSKSRRPCQRVGRVVRVGGLPVADHLRRDERLRARAPDRHRPRRTAGLYACRTAESHACRTAESYACRAAWPHAARNSLTTSAHAHTSTAARGDPVLVVNRRTPPPQSHNQYSNDRRDDYYQHYNERYQHHRLLPHRSLSWRQWW